MELQTIEMARPDALRAFRQYQEAVRARHSAEDEQMMKGFRALAEGKRVIDLPAAMRQAGTVDVQTRGGQLVRFPRLAAVTATATMCWLDGDTDRFWFSAHPSVDGPRIRRGITSAFTVFSRDTVGVSQYARGRAIVPIIPPALRPARGLGTYHVLWEATWEPVAPVDPALLKHIGGNLWAVVATWDLTPLEQAVVMGRLR